MFKMATRYTPYRRLRGTKTQVLLGTRQQSTALQFYQNRQLEFYASKEAKRLTLRQLVRVDWTPCGLVANICKRFTLVDRWMKSDLSGCVQSLQRLFSHNGNILECKLCPHRTTSSNCTPASWSPSSALCCRDTGRGCQSLRSTYCKMNCFQSYSPVC